MKKMDMYSLSNVQALMRVGRILTRLVIADKDLLNSEIEELKSGFTVRLKQLSIALNSVIKLDLTLPLKLCGSLSVLKKPLFQLKRM